MRDRPAVVVRAEDEEGVVGWGETWCNFPTVGAEHRAHLINENCAEIIVDQIWQSPQAAFAEVTRQLHVLTIQAAEPGPIAQAIAGVDIALWDISAKKANQPLYQHLRTAFDLGENQDITSVPCYASGINPDVPEKTALAACQEGYNAFKLKVGFEDELDVRNLTAMREELGPDVKIMIDANQRWDHEQAKIMANNLGECDPFWLEEPIAADRPRSEWQALATSSPIELAAGENLRGGDLSAVCEDKYLQFIQPDIAKWGGFSGCFPIAQKALEHGKIYCPHYLGGGIGLIASAHLLAAVGGPGLLEVDFNPNSLRELLANPLPSVNEGHFEVPQNIGLGIEPEFDQLKRFRTM